MLLCWVAISSLVSARPYFNDQKAPESLDDLQNIQKAVQASLPKARAATVCVELKEGSGSGVIISPDGLVLTAAHVSGGVDEELTLVFEDGKKLKARSLGLNSDNDAAMIQITDPGPFPYVDYETVTNFELGDWVFALGHSGGFDKERGVVTRVGRVVRLSSDTIRTDCMLIGGDSGGPLFNSDGTLIAIHSRVGMIKEDSQHVPLEAFERKWSEMKASEFLGNGPFAQRRKPGTGYLGVSVALESHGERLVIDKVGEDTPASRAGLEAGMALLKLNDHTLTSVEQFQKLMGKMAKGDEIRLTWERQEEIEEITVELEARP